MASTILTGVWISDQPLDANEGATGEQLLAIELNFDINCYEVVEDKSTYREWCVPADLLNGAGVKVRLMSQVEEDEWQMARWHARSTHDHLCLSRSSGLCLECAQLENIREDERYRVLEQITAMPADSSRDDILAAVAPMSGDVLRRKEPYADLDH